MGDFEVSNPSGIKRVLGLFWRKPVKLLFFIQKKVEQGKEIRKRTVHAELRGNGCKLAGPDEIAANHSARRRSIFRIGWDSNGARIPVQQQGVPTDQCYMFRLEVIVRQT